MPFKVGKPKTGGRVKGVANKPTQDLMALCESKGLNVFEAMVEIAITEQNRDKRFDRLTELAQYLYPKRKALEHSGQMEGIRVIIEDYSSKEG